MHTELQLTSFALQNRFHSLPASSPLVTAVPASTLAHSAMMADHLELASAPSDAPAEQAAAVPEARTPAPMPELPKEVLLSVLKMSTEALSFSSRYRNLKHAALVAKAWRAPSQEMLCRDAVFHSVVSIERWLEVRWDSARAIA